MYKTGPTAQRTIGVTSNLPVGRISVVTLIRTDTTLDHSQKAEKVWMLRSPEQTQLSFFVTSSAWMVKPWFAGKNLKTACIAVDINFFWFSFSAARGWSEPAPPGQNLCSLKVWLSRGASWSTLLSTSRRWQPSMLCIRWRQCQYWGIHPAKIEEFTLLRSFHGNL